MGRKRQPKQYDMFEERERKDKRNQQARTRRKVKADRKLPIPHRGDQGVSTTNKPKPAGSRLPATRVAEGEYIEKDKPKGRTPAARGNTYEGETSKPKDDGQKKIENKKAGQKALPKPEAQGSKGSRFLKAIKTVGKRAGLLGLAITAADMANNTKNAPREDVDRRGRPNKPKAAAKPEPKAEPKAESKKKNSAGSFKDAFAKARKAYQSGDGGKTFEWNGKKYSVATKDDVKKSGKKDLREYLNAGLSPERKKK